jgi:ATP-dependent RNA helicase HelY
VCRPEESRPELRSPAAEAAEDRAAARAEGGAAASPISEFESAYGFRFDDFQSRACSALLTGKSVLVAAPTGAGKTVVGEFAAWLALRARGKTFYTTPIKALSNQKYSDFVALHGHENVGLLTGDNSLNGDAPIVVMTTEVLRNMIYEDSPTLDGLHYVVLDEVHYLQDRYRGAVWEEVLIHLPVDVLTVSLSATVSNAEEFAEWLKTLRGETEAIIEEERPVEIKHWYFATDELIPMFVARPGKRPEPNPKGREFDRKRRRPGQRPQRGGRRTRERRPRPPLRTDVIDRLDQDDMLPAIYFIFSRRGCDDAVFQCLRDNVRLTTDEEAREVVAYADERVSELDPEELEVLGYDGWIEGLRRGVAAHHAGMIPPFKETVEHLFNRGLVKVVFATETLALGINMPARSVVIESLTKFTGEKHELMRPGEYTQLSGRAGRRGIDEVGHCVVLMQRFTPFDQISQLASTRTYPLQSSFQPSYNMAVNLVRNYDKDQADHLVNSSFGQFQADRDVVQLERTKERLETYQASYHEKMTCERGDVGEYKKVFDRLRDIEERTEGGRRAKRGARVAEAIDALRPGDVIQVVGGRRKGRYAVVDVSSGGTHRGARVTAVSEDRGLVRFSPADFAQPPMPVGFMRLPRDFNVRSPKARRSLARKLGQADLSSPRRTGSKEKLTKEERAARKAVESHPVHGCPDLSRHLHFADRAARLDKELRGIERRIKRRTQTLARRFERVLKILEKRGLVYEWALTPKGETLTGIYNESDLLVVEALERRLFLGLDPPEMSALASALVFEPRGPDEVIGYMPTAASRREWQVLMELWRSIRKDEEDQGLELTREPHAGFAEIAHLWAAGAALDEVLEEDDAPGDFVRSTKQLADLLRQIEDVAATDELRDGIRTALDAIHRGVVAYSSL